MPASAVFPSDAPVDLSAAIYGIELAGDTSGGALRAQSERFFFASKVVLQAGREPSYAVAEIPLTQFEERAPALAGVNGGALEGIQIGTRARVFVYTPTATATLLAGSVVNIQQDLSSDGATLTVFDDRWLLQGVPVSGQFVRDPASGSVVYAQRLPARFNPHGRPNCLDTPNGPLFAPCPAYGREDGDSDPVPGAASRAARPWRIGDILAYLRQTLCTETFSGATVAFPWFLRVDAERLVVPASFGTELESDDAAQTPGKAPDITLEGLDLLAAFTRVLESAGAYALNCGASEDSANPFAGGALHSVLEIVPTRYTENSGALTVLRPAAGGIGESAGRIGVVAGQLEEDGSDLFTEVVVAGDAVKLELRVEFGASGAGLEKGWTAEDEDAFRAHIRDHPDNPDSPQAFLEACWKFPRVFAAYQVPATFDYLGGTKYAGFPRLQTHPPILPHLLSMLSENSGGGRRRMFPYPVSVELKDDGGDYRARSLLDGLEVDDDGTLWLTAHREAELYARECGTWRGELSDPDKLAPRDLRITLALQMDARLCAALSLSNSEKDGAAADPAGDSGRVASGLRRQYFADAGSAYREHLRRDSWPVPESAGGEMFPTRAASASELLSDHARAASHARRRLAEVGRTRRTGRLVFPSAMFFQPGQAIAALDNRGLASSYPVRGVVARVIHNYRANTTEIELV